ncbi:vacuolar ATP synthase subunit e 2 [Trichinella spiralis]|uniref:vacuolar ATP synthase subunit e 2 n=1 Tax=Trichinella spiralis TaxID=6334 RepID=UPI0001EFC190|nr:vacuolar ATP synthase subunit e 2 [Trichinella spiralis]
MGKHRHRAATAVRPYHVAGLCERRRSAGRPTPCRSPRSVAVTARVYTRSVERSALPCVVGFEHLSTAFQGESEQASEQAEKRAVLEQKQIVVKHQRRRRRRESDIETNTETEDCRDRARVVGRDREEIEKKKNKKKEK